MKQQNAASDWQILAENMNDGLLVNLNGRHVFVNHCMADMLGYAPEELIGTGIKDVVHPDEIEKVVERNRSRIVGKDEPNRYETMFVTKTNEKLPVELSVALTEWESEPAVMVLVRDIRSRLHFEDELRRTQEQFTDLTASVPGVVYQFMIDADGNRSFPFVSPTIHKLFGLQAKDVMADADLWFGIIHSEDLPAMEASVAESAQTLNRWLYEGRMLHQSTGETVWFRGTSEPRKLDDGSILWHGILLDISDRKITEVALEESEFKYRSLFNDAPDMIHLVSPDGRIMDANQTELDTMGYSRSEYIGKSLKELIHPDFLEPSMAVAKRVFSGESIVQHETVMVSSDGTSIPIEINATPFFENGKVIYARTILRDISARKQAAWALKEKSRRQQEIIDSLFGFIGIYSLDGILLEANDAPIQAAGLKREEVIGQYFPDAYWWSFSTEVQEKLRDALTRAAQGETVRYDTPVRIKDGVIIFIDVMFGPLFDDAGGVKEIIGFGVDITERKQVETALREREILLKQAQHVAHMGYIDWNPITNEVTWSEETFRIFGCPQDFKPTLESTVALVHPEDTERVTAVLNAAVQDKQDYNIEHRMVRLDGKEIQVHTKGGLTVNAQGNVVRMLGTVIDITERKKIEAELTLHREHLEELVDARTSELKAAQDQLLRKERLATLGQLTATVSHELRNPLGAMRPSLYFIGKKSDKKDERVQQAIERLDRNIERCDHIIDELLDFTRITILDKHSTRFDEWLESVIDEQNIPAGIRLEKDYTLKDVELAIDTYRLRRAVINVVENACHAMLDEKHQTKIKQDSCLGIKTAGNDERLEIVIADTGTGISDDVLEKIFEPLFSTKGFGVGLGMSTVKQIMEQHDGGVEIETKVGHGTKITLWLSRNSS